MSESALLERIVLDGLKKCADKLSRVSTAAWSVSGAETSMGTLDGAVRRHSASETEALAIYFEVRGELPFTSIILFDPRDTVRVSRSLLGYAFSDSPGLNQAGELLLTELGNIILNSLVSSLSNTLGRIFLPSAPVCLRGEPQHLLEVLGASADLRHCHTVCVRLDIRCGGGVTRSEALCLVPPKLAQELSKAETGPREPL